MKIWLKCNWLFITLFHNDGARVCVCGIYCVDDYAAFGLTYKYNSRVEDCAIVDFFLWIVGISVETAITFIQNNLQKNKIIMDFFPFVNFFFKHILIADYLEKRQLSFFPRVWNFSLYNKATMRTLYLQATISVNLSFATRAASQLQTRTQENINTIQLGRLEYRCSGVVHGGQTVWRYSWFVGIFISKPRTYFSSRVVIGMWIDLNKLHSIYFSNKQSPAKHKIIQIILFIRMKTFLFILSSAAAQ